MPVITVAGRNIGECRLQWNGTGIAPETLEGRAFAVVQETLANVGGITNLAIDSPPVFEVEAAGDTPFACIALALGDLANGAILRVALRPVGGSPGPVANLFLPTDAEQYVPVAVIEIGTGDRLYFNRQPVDFETVRQTARSLPAQASMPKDVIVVPSGDASFGAIDQVVRAVGESGVEFMLADCARAIQPPGPDEMLVGELVPPCRGVTS